MLSVIIIIFDRGDMKEQKYTTLISTILHSSGMEAKRGQRRNKERKGMERQTKGKRETEDRSSTDTQTHDCLGIDLLAIKACL